MVGREYDLVGNPLGAVRSTFEKAIEAGGSNPEPSFLIDGKDWGATQLFHQFLLDQPSALSQIPILDRTSLPHLQPNTLVRYRGMVQDMLGNEFYVGVHKNGEGSWTTNKFTDVSHLPLGTLSENTRIWERRLLYCVPVPGQNLWAESYSESVTSPCSNVMSPHGEKRSRDDCEDMDFQASDQDFQGSTSAKKMRENMHCPLLLRSEEHILHGSTSNSDMVPFDIKSLSCLVKIYDTLESELKLNDVFEFVGLLTFDTKLAAEDDTCDELCEDELVHLPPRKVPRLHCIVHRKLAIHDFLSASLTLEPKSSLVKGVRESLLKHLTSVLGNDDLAAQFMLMHLLSGVHTRFGLVAIGKLSLNLTCFSKEILTVFGNRIKVAVANLVPFTMCMPLTIDHLNSASLAPAKDYQTNRLVSGPLQLSEGTHLIVDATELQTGTLNSVGVENVRLLKTLLESQKVDYDFKYYKMEMAADAQVLILSEGKSNILPADVILPFHPQAPGVSEYVDMEALKAWRCYLATFRSLQHSIDSEMQKIVEDDLVAARQSDRSLGSSDFSSFGETCLSLEHWQMVMEMERLRRERSKPKIVIGH
ncbi:mini-chromosome maintenance complex-binding protein isoform X2 [Apium graveolens]|uniref:mini-chromosome maintenance complex-binding protein isoform X2 n=1 Tax=Apium graveolens TaxID=4045 RepID=UPI003D79492F